MQKCFFSNVTLQEDGSLLPKCAFEGLCSLSRLVSTHYSMLYKQRKLNLFTRVLHSLMNPVTEPAHVWPPLCGLETKHQCEMT